MTVRLPLDLPLDEIARICVRHGILELSLFGSAARRDDVTAVSDIDLLYVADRHSDDHRPDLFELERELQELLGRQVDLVPKDGLHWVIRDEVLAEAQVLYEAS